MSDWVYHMGFCISRFFPLLDRFPRRQYFQNQIPPFKRSICLQHLIKSWAVGHDCDFVRDFAHMLNSHYRIGEIKRWFEVWMAIDVIINTIWKHVKDWTLIDLLGWWFYAAKLKEYRQCSLCTRSCSLKTCSKFLTVINSSTASRCVVLEDTGRSGVCSHSEWLCDDLNTVLFVCNRGWPILSHVARVHGL